MTRDIKMDGCIDRRTALGLLSGGVATLAGCSGEPSSGSSESTGSGDTGLEYPGSGWIEPAEQSEYITGSEIVADEDNVYLELQLQNSVDITFIKLIDAQNNQFDSGLPDSGTARIALAEGYDYGTEVPTIITPGENTLLIEFEDDREERIPFRLETSVTFQTIQRLGYNELGITIKNTGSHSTVPWRTDYGNVPDDNSLNSSISAPDGHILHLREPKVLQPGETHTVTHPSALWISCEDLGTRTLEFTVRSMWANDVSISQPVTYSDDLDQDCTSFEGEPTVTAGQSTESDDQ